MAMVDEDDSCHFFLADSQSKSVGYLLLLDHKKKLL